MTVVFKFKIIILLCKWFGQDINSWSKLLVIVYIYCGCWNGEAIIDSDSCMKNYLLV